MELTQALANITNRWNLLENPFYKAWSEGTLSTEALQRYASDYGHFIALLPLGWQTLGDSETASEEQEHRDLWNQFGESIETIDRPMQMVEVKTLVQTAQHLFTQPASAMGALYAFEVQQPQTASSKLTGLRTHYQHLGADEAYFVAHTHNEHEADKLLERMTDLSPEDQQAALASCEAMSQAIWDALVAIGS